jgi:hypothetical protein
MSSDDLANKKCFHCGGTAGNHESYDGYCPINPNQPPFGGWRHSKFIELADVELVVPQKNEKKLSKECPCGISRSDCEYHK